MCRMILKVSLNMRTSIESGPDAFLSLNLSRAVVSWALVNVLSGDFSKCKSLLLGLGYADIPNNFFVGNSILFCQDIPTREVLTASHLEKKKYR